MFRGRVAGQREILGDDGRRLVQRSANLGTKRYGRHLSRIFEPHSERTLWSFNFQSLQKFITDPRNVERARQPVLSFPSLSGGFLVFFLPIAEHDVHHATVYARCESLNVTWKTHTHTHQHTHTNTHTNTHTHNTHTHTSTNTDTDTDTNTQYPVPCTQYPPVTSNQ